MPDEKWLDIIGTRIFKRHSSLIQYLLFFLFQDLLVFFWVEVWAEGGRCNKVGMFITVNK